MHSELQRNSENHEITVYDTTELYGEKGSFRVMQFSNHATQGAMDLNDPQRILFEYPRAIIHFMEFNLPSLRMFFLLGMELEQLPGIFRRKDLK